jgi:hypothetical protein
MLEQTKEMLDSAHLVAGYGCFDRSSAAWASAWELFHKAYIASALGRTWGAITGNSPRLSSMPVASMPPGLQLRRVTGVPIRSIVGSIEACRDFDRSFRPARIATRGAWIALARAVQLGKPLGPVELARMRKAYYVRKGHMRISVAAALGRSEVDAIVTDVGRPPDAGLALSGSEKPMARARDAVSAAAAS